MKKIFLFSLGLLFFLFLTRIIFFEKQVGFSFSLDPLFAIHVDDQLVGTFPSKDSLYVLTEKTYCNNGVKVFFNPIKWDLDVSFDEVLDSGTRAFCNLYFRKATFSEILSYCEDTSLCFRQYHDLESSLVVDETVDHNLRYVGKNPNNYVSFNNELWRIIGVMNNVDDGLGNKKTRLKIVRNESIGEYSWDTTPSYINSGLGINEWSEADLMKLLNPGYEEESVGGSLYWNRKKGNCYMGENNQYEACDFTLSGLEDSSKSFIFSSLWYTGANEDENNYNQISPQKFYTLERSNYLGKVCSGGDYCNDSVTRKASFRGMIGLMNMSDYGYATSNKQCYELSVYNWYDDCKNNNWLFKANQKMWTLNPGIYPTHAIDAFSIKDDGIAKVMWTTIKMNIFPTIYLDASVSIEKGSGTFDDPFVLIKK